MTKRKLNKQQQHRIKQNKAREVEQAATSRENDTSQTLGPKTFGLVITRHAKQADIEDESGHRLSALIRQNIGSLTAGDRIVFQRNINAPGGIIISRLKRETVLGRGDKKGDIRPVAANVQQMFIVIASKPQVTSILLDSYLVASENLNIQPIIIYNKIDIDLDGPLIEYYRSIGYPVIATSTLNQSGIKELVDATNHHISVFVGQSGVGKSSLISTLIPDEDIRRQSISTHSSLGKHTTSNSTLYHIPTGGSLIDSPGIREFGLWHLAPHEIIEGFVEFRDLSGQCKFKNCTHLTEPGCAMIQFAEEKHFIKERLHSLQYLLKKH